MGVKSDALRLEMAEIGEKIREINSKDKPEAADYDKLKDLVGKMDERRGQLSTVEAAEKIDAEFAKPAEPKARGGEMRGDKPVGFGQYFQAVASLSTAGGLRTMPQAEAREILRPKMAATGMSEAVSSDGGFLVTNENGAMLSQRAYDEGKIARLCQKITIGGPFNGLTYPVIDESSRVDGSRAGGVRGYWINEAGAATSSKPKVRRDTMSLEKLGALCYVTEELLQDASALEGLLLSEYGKEMAFKLDDAILNGDGAAKPLGIYNAGCLVQQAKETGQAADTIKAENVINMYSRFWGSSGVWVLNKDCFPQLMKLALPVGTGGVPLYIPGNSLANAPYGSLLGMPVIFSEQAQTVGDLGDIYLADFGQYRLIDKGGVQSDSSMHVQFIYDEMVFRFIYRVNGQPLWDSALTPFKGSNTVSPFVALAARA